MSNPREPPNIPKRDKVVKGGFRPKLDCFLFFDYRQVEYRLLAYYVAVACDDESMAEVFRQGKDLHEETARRVLGIWDRPLTDLERDVGKTWNFLTIYGGGAQKAANSLGIPLELAQEQRELFFATWPSLKRLNNPPFRNGRYAAGEGPGAIQRAYEAKGYLTTILGRHLHPQEAHKALNAVIQGSAAELTRRALVEVHKQLKQDQLKSHLVNVVHDELILDAVEEELPYLAGVVPTLMDYPRVSKVVPIECDCEVSWTTWAEKEPYEGPGNDEQQDDLGLPGSPLAAAAA